MLRAMLILAALAVPATAQCPHQEIVRQAESIRAGRSMGCGGVTIATDGIKFESRICPAYVLITPAHDRTGFRAGSGTYTEPAGRVDVTLLKFTCG